MQPQQIESKQQSTFTSPTIQVIINKKHIPCKYYRNGVCKLGDQCPYSHVLPYQIPTQTVPFLHQTNLYSPSLSYAEDVDKNAVLAMEALGYQTSICKYYMMGLQCKYGDNCKFLHPTTAQNLKTRHQSYYWNAGPNQPLFYVNMIQKRNLNEDQWLEEQQRRCWEKLTQHSTEQTESSTMQHQYHPDAQKRRHYYLGHHQGSKLQNMKQVDEMQVKQLISNLSQTLEQLFNFELQKEEAQQVTSTLFSYADVVKKNEEYEKIVESPLGKQLKENLQELAKVFPTKQEYSWISFSELLKNICEWKSQYLGKFKQNGLEESDLTIQISLQQDKYKVEFVCKKFCKGLQQIISHVTTPTLSHIPIFFTHIINQEEQIHSVQKQEPEQAVPKQPESIPSKQDEKLIQEQPQSTILSYAGIVRGTPLK